MLPAFSDNCNSLFVVAREHTNQQGPAFRLKRNTITNPKLQHLGMGPHVIQEFQPLDNPVVEINKFSFGSPSMSIFMTTPDITEILLPSGYHACQYSTVQSYCKSIAAISPTSTQSEFH